MPESEILRHQPLYREKAGRIFKFLYEVIVGMRGFEDTQCGFKVFSGDLARYIFSLQRIDGFLILSDRSYPGWKATVDGLETPIYKANYIFRGLYLKNGAHHIEFCFEPLSFRIGVYLSLAVIVLLLLTSLIML